MHDPQLQIYIHRMRHADVAAKIYISLFHIITQGQTYAIFLSYFSSYLNISLCIYNSLF